MELISLKANKILVWCLRKRSQSLDLGQHSLACGPASCQGGGEGRVLCAAPTLPCLDQIKKVNEALEMFLL